MPNAYADARAKRAPEDKRLVVIKAYESELGISRRIFFEIGRKKVLTRAEECSRIAPESNTN